MSKIAFETFIFTLSCFIIGSVLTTILEVYV